MAATFDLRAYVKELILAVKLGIGSVQLILRIHGQGDGSKFRQAHYANYCTIFQNSKL